MWRIDTYLHDFSSEWIFKNIWFMKKIFCALETWAFLFLKIDIFMPEKFLPATGIILQIAWLWRNFWRHKVKICLDLREDCLDGPWKVYIQTLELNLTAAKWPYFFHISKISGPYRGMKIFYIAHSISTISRFSIWKKWSKVGGRNFEIPNKPKIPETFCASKDILNNIYFRCKIPQYPHFYTEMGDTEYLHSSIWARYFRDMEKIRSLCGDQIELKSLYINFILPLVTILAHI